jgi:hypothetical protein
MTDALPEEKVRFFLYLAVTAVHNLLFPVRYALNLK